MTETTDRIRYHSASSRDPFSVQKRLRDANRLDEESGEPELSDRRYLETLFVEMLAQQVAARRHLLILATISVLGVVAGVICAIVIAVQVTHANNHVSSPSYSLYGG